MKTLKNLIATGGLLTAVLIAAPSFAQYPAYPNAHAAVNADLERIAAGKQAIRNLEAKYDSYRKSGDETATLAAKSDLARAVADLKRDEAYLKADKKALLYNYQLAITERRKELKKEKAEKKSYRDKLEKSIDNGDEVSATKYAAALATSNRDIRNSEVALLRAKNNKDKGLLVIDRQLNGEVSGKTVLYSDNATAVKNIDFNRLSK
jgi:hypothetical protein